MSDIMPGDLILFTQESAGVSANAFGTEHQLEFGFESGPYCNICAGEIGILLKKSFYEELGDFICEILIGSEIFYDVSSKDLQKILPAPAI